MIGVGIDPSMQVLHLFKSHLFQKLARLKASDSVMAIDNNIPLPVELRNFLGKLGERNMQGVRDPDPGMLPSFTYIDDEEVFPLVQLSLEVGGMKLKILVAE